MIIENSDIIDWVSDNKITIAMAWSVYWTEATVFEEYYSHSFASMLTDEIIIILSKNGTDRDFLESSQSNLSKDILLRFYFATLKLARAATRRARIDRSRSVFPYIRASVVGDTKTHKGHLALDGIVLPYEHQFWHRWHPPIGMDCRCRAISITKGQFLRRNLVITSEEELAYRLSKLSGDWPVSFQSLLDYREPY